MCVVSSCFRIIIDCFKVLRLDETPQQAQMRGAAIMKSTQNPAYNLPPIRRRNFQGGYIASGTDRAVGLHRAFERARYRRSDRDDTTAFGAGALDGRRRRMWTRVALRERQPS